MNYTHEDILEALKMFKNICESIEDCDLCPLRDKWGNCNLKEEEPRNYRITGEAVPEAWKAFTN